MNVQLREKLHNHSPRHISKFLLDVLKRRAIGAATEFELSLKNLVHSEKLPDIHKASERIVKAILNQEIVLIAGDYDVDGASSVALMVRALKDFGLRNIHYIVPHRIEDGYGLTEGLLLKSINPKPDLIITVDNGMSSYDAIELANSLNIDVIVTDHHLQTGRLPKAYAIVNPNREGSDFTESSLCGVGVAFYVLCSVRSSLIDNHGIQHALPKVTQYLDLVALGTISDLVPFSYNNRCLVHQGLLRIRKQQGNLGILAICELVKKKPNTLTSLDIAFGIAPLLNAAGRLSDMRLSVECLLADDQTKAKLLAKELFELNQERKSIENEMVHIALENLTKSSVYKGNTIQPIILYDERFHSGVIGILAAKIKEQYEQPVIVFSKEKGILKGSGRSIKGLHFKDLLDQIYEIAPDLLINYGGHEMAIGLSLYESNLSRFQEILDLLTTAQTIEKEALPLLIDGSLVSSQITVDNIELLNLAIPWGQDFPEPLFCNKFEIVDSKILKNEHIKLTLKFEEESFYIEALAFFKAQDWHVLPKKISAVYKLSINEWNGRKIPQLIIEDFCEI